MDQMVITHSITDRFFDQQNFLNYSYSMKNIIEKCFQNNQQNVKLDMTKI